MKTDGHSPPPHLHNIRVNETKHNVILFGQKKEEQEEE